MSKPNSATEKTASANEDEAENGCTHHWVIEPPNGSVSRGKCKHCGESEEFRNSFEYSSWYGTKSPSAANKARAAKASAKASK